jgi:hypothetical protein
MLYNKELEDSNKRLKAIAEDLIHRNELILARMKITVKLKPAE